jgi:hypothetical protein
VAVVGPDRDDRGRDIPVRPDIRIERVQRRTRWAATALLLAMPAAAFLIPSLGGVLSFFAMVAAASLGQRIWPVGAWKAGLAGVAMFAALWGTMFVGASLWDLDQVTEYLIVPLCAPVGRAAILPGLAAVGAYLAIIVPSVRTRRVWLWPIATAAGSLVFDAVWAQIDQTVSWVC